MKPPIQDRLRKDHHGCSYMIRHEAANALDAANARIAELDALVAEAYHEAYIDAFSEGLSAGHDFGHGYDASDPDGSWLSSDVHDALNPKEPTR